ncbi:hypothetical protein BpHYR1_018845 [Brachionus plicatilis]|uniref:Uncharacterized protein n=1 Tax=Brachionus plicatilis TaxID=10195 RepID=A0A3M7PKQ4_BRAPC|nr:hypothetical protein BpHYR1_018845 [Brachionus plicatilis]
MDLILKTILHNFMHTDIIVEIISHELGSSPRCLRLNVITTPEPRGNLQGFIAPNIKLSNCLGIAKNLRIP